MIEFLGGETLESATSVYVTKTDDCAYDPRELRMPTEVNWYLDRNFDIARSLADHQSLLFHLDIEYVNFDSPVEAYCHPTHTFEVQQVVVHGLESMLLEWGIRPLHLITGQGHHFVWRVDRSSDLAKEVRALNLAPEIVPLCMERVPTLFQHDINEEMQSSFVGVGLLMEYVVHRLKALVAGKSELPVEITAVHTGPSTRGMREIISLDISEYGDPLHSRMIRMPFTNYLKPRLTSLFQVLSAEYRGLTLRSIPLFEMDLHSALEVRLHEAQTRELAKRACVRIPEQSKGTANLLRSYLSSRLRHFHQFFYEAQHDPPEVWGETYEKTPLQDLPPCVRRILEWPNDLLLKPAGIQLVTRCLLAMDWHPRHIAGLIRSLFSNPLYAWGVDWNSYEAGTRADFYVRNFSGLYETGLDRLVDFNCFSTQEKGFCSDHPEITCSLQPFHDKLLSRQCR